VRLDRTHDRPIRASRAGTVAALQQERSSSCDGDGDGDVDVDGDDGGQSLHPADCRRESADQASLRAGALVGWERMRRISEGVPGLLLLGGC